MGPELHFQMIASRAAELRQEAANQRRVREAQASRKAPERTGHGRLRGAFGKFRTA